MSNLRRTEVRGHGLGWHFTTAPSRDGALGAWSRGLPSPTRPPVSASSASTMPSRVAPPNQAAFFHRPAPPYAARPRLPLARQSVQAEPREERFISVADILQEVKVDGDNFVFEDLEDDSQELWAGESRFLTDPQEIDHDMPAPVPTPDDLRKDPASAYSADQGYSEISAAELAAAREKGTFVLDVRTPEEFARGHVPGATNVPLDALSDFVKSGKLDDYRNSKMAVVCQAGRRGAQAAVRLSKVFHFTDVSNVTGGTSAWSEAGYPIEL